MITSIETIKKDLKEMLSEKRYNHCIGVMEKAIELAKLFDVDEEKAAYVGLTHDMAKEMSDEESINYIKYNNIKVNKYDLQVRSSWHGIIAADIVGKKYGFSKDMQEAIRYHTILRENMTNLDKVLFLADKAEEKTRDYNFLQGFNDLIKNEGLDSAILYAIEEWTIPEAFRKNKLIHPNSIYARNEIILNNNIER